MKSKATGCGMISTIFSSIVLLCVSSIIIMMIITIIIIVIIIIIIIIIVITLKCWCPLKGHTYLNTQMKAAGLFQ